MQRIQSQYSMRKSIQYCMLEQDIQSAIPAPYLGLSLCSVWRLVTNHRSSGKPSVLILLLWMLIFAAELNIFYLFDGHYQCLILICQSTVGSSHLPGVELQC